MTPRLDKDSQIAPRHGLLLLQGIIVALFVLFALRLWYVQIHKGEHFEAKARENRLRKEAIYAPRGLVRDRDGTLVAVNEPAYALALIREDVRDMDATLARVSEWTGVEVTTLREVLQKKRGRVKSFEPLVLVDDIAFDLVARIESASHRWPGLDVVVRPKRFYPQDLTLSHIMGYVAEASEEEMEADPTLALGDTVGKRGMELVQEPTLRGIKGRTQLEVNAMGRTLQQAQVRPPRAGQALQLSIDLDVQRLAMAELEKFGGTGSVVVMEPHTGQLLALVSSPGYNNNAFTGGLSHDEWAVMRDDPRHPLQNRVLQSAYPPASVFKLLVAGAALHYGVANPQEEIFCPGKIKLGNRVFRCWKREGHGKMDLEQALAQSCDVYFYEMGTRLGVDRIEEFARASGFGQRTGIDLPGEKAGLIPSREWKRKRFSERWQGGENLNLAIGQGYTLTTPLQVARFIAALVNGGTLVKPQLLMDVPVQVQGSLPATDEVRERIVAAMIETVDGQRGTAWKLRTPGVLVGGKTGTAQVVKLLEKYEDAELEEIPRELRDHGWIAAFGRAEEGPVAGREVVIVVMVEHGGGGSSAAAPVAKALLDQIFGNLGEDAHPLVAWPSSPPLLQHLSGHDQSDQSGQSGTGG